MPRPLQPAVHIVTILINQIGYSEEKHVIFIYLPWAKLTGLLWMFRGGAQDNLDNMDHSRLFLILSITITIQICYFRMKKFTWQCAMKRTWRVAFREYLVHLGISRYKVGFTFGTFWFFNFWTLWYTSSVKHEPAATMFYLSKSALWEIIVRQKAVLCPRTSPPVMGTKSFFW